jgi:hypothetical protein
VDIPDDGLCPPSDASSSLEFGVIKFFISCSEKYTETLPMMCSKCAGALSYHLLFFSFVSDVARCGILGVLKMFLSRLSTSTGTANGGSSLAVVTGVDENVMFFRCVAMCG